MRSAIWLIFLVTTAIAPARAQSVGNPHGPTIGACISCHRANSWRPAQVSRDFRHAEQVFPLDGAHLRTACTACHASLDFSKASTSCAQCHRDVHKSELGSDCGRCHTTRSFVDQTNLKRLHEMTRFPLRGAHAPLACEACHTAARPGQSQYVRRPRPRASAVTWRRTGRPSLPTTRRRSSRRTARCATRCPAGPAGGLTMPPRSSR